MESENNRIMIVDDNTAIHNDFMKILGLDENSDNEIPELENMLFNRPENKIRDEIRYQIDHAYQGDEAVLMVEKAEKVKSPYALIFMDVRMPPGIDGVESIKKIWQINADVEVVICTAYSDYSWETMIDILGTCDNLLFLKKPFNSIEVRQLALSLIKKWNLKNKYKSFISTLELEVKKRTEELDNLLTTLKTTNEQLHHKNLILSEISRKDSLTGLLNHLSLHQQAEEIFNYSRTEKFPFSIIMMDIDSFKRINDSYGHLMGDLVIKKIAEVLKNKLWHKDDDKSYNGNDLKCRFDVIGRYGGDEFTILMPYCGKKEAMVIAEKLRHEIELIKFKGNPDLVVSASIGIGTLPEDVRCENSNAIIKLADKALYDSKSKGKNMVSIICLDENTEPDD